MGKLFQTLENLLFYRTLVLAYLGVGREIQKKTTGGSIIQCRCPKVACRNIN